MQVVNVELAHNYHYLNNKNVAALYLPRQPMKLNKIISQNKVLSGLLCGVHEIANNLFRLVQNTVLSVSPLCENITNKIAPNCWSQIEGGLTPSVLNFKKESYMNLSFGRVLHPNRCVSSVHPKRAFNQGGAL